MVVFIIIALACISGIYQYFHLERFDKLEKRVKEIDDDIAKIRTELILKPKDQGNKFTL